VFSSYSHSRIYVHLVIFSFLLLHFLSRSYH